VSTKISIAIIAVAVIVAGLLIWYSRTHAPAAVTTLTEEFTWSFIDRGVSSSTPQTDVALRIAGVDVPLGTFDGTCSALAGSQWPFLSGEISGAICYTASGGIEIGVFEQGGKLVLEQGEVGPGDAAHPGTRTNFKPLTKQPQL
jgi:hypothetical protein